MRRGEAYLVRYIGDFAVCCQYREDAVRVQQPYTGAWQHLDLLWNRARRCWSSVVGWLSGTRRSGRTRSETIDFLGFALYGTRNRQGNFTVGFRTEKSRLLRSIARLSDLIRCTRHLPVRKQAINRLFRRSW